MLIRRITQAFDGASCSACLTEEAEIHYGQGFTRLDRGIVWLQSFDDLLRLGNKPNQGIEMSKKSAVPKVPECEVLRVSFASLDCPNCETTQDGWLIDPRGKVHTCDSCKKDYRVGSDVKLSL